MNKKIIIPIIISILLSITVTTSTGNFLKISKNTLQNQNLGNSTDIPSWYPQHQWKYQTNITYKSENISFTGTIDNLTFKVKKITTISIHNQKIPVYKNEIIGDINGTLKIKKKQTGFPLPITGKINGYSYTKLSDLSQIKINLDITGTTQIGMGMEIWIFDIAEGQKIPFEINLENTFTPPLENYDFPIKTKEKWSTISTANISAKVSVAGGEHKQELSTTFTEQTNFTCTKKDDFQTPLGTYTAYYLSTTDLNNNSICYIPEIKNVGKIDLEYTDRNNSLLIDSQIKSFHCPKPSLKIQAKITPDIQIPGKKITIHGKITDTQNHQPVTNETVTIQAPNVEKKWITQTNHNGNYTITVPAPNISDYTPSSNYFGSNGIIVWCTHNGETIHKVRTLISKKDTIKPEIKIDKPRTNFLYFNNKKICKFFNTYVIGDIEIKTSAIDYETSIKKVKIYINNQLQTTLEQPPYTYHWKQKNTGTHTIKTVAIDKSGNQNSDQITINKLF